MAGILVLSENKYFNLEDQTLYVDGSPAGKPLKGIPFRIVEYLALNSPNPRTQDQIRENCWKEDNGEGSVAYHIRKARQALQDEKLPGTRKYQYLVELDGKYYCSIGVTEDVSGTQKEEEEENPVSETEKLQMWRELLDEVQELGDGYRNAVSCCNVKWGACTLDQEPQNTNTCEGLIAMALSCRMKEQRQDWSFRLLLEECFGNLSQELSENGLSSKTLGVPTTVPTSMFLYVMHLYSDYVKSDRVDQLAERLWSCHARTGWGIYVDKMSDYHTNIGCTYWAVMGLLSQGYGERPEFQAFLCSLFRYDHSSTFGAAIGYFATKLPNLYSTAMMYILYSCISEEWQQHLPGKYEKKKALDFILENFDNLFYQTEQEEIRGTFIPGKIEVRTLNWNHMTIHYSLLALSIAIRNGDIPEEEILPLSKRVLEALKKNTEERNGVKFWCSPREPLERSSRGMTLFPTMHALMGLSYYKDAVLKKILKKEEDSPGIEKELFP